MMYDLFSQFIRFTLGATFLLVGIAEICPDISHEVPVLKVFKDFSHVEFLAVFFSNDELYRVIVGTLELTCSVLILFSSGASEAAMLSYYILLSLMLGVVYTHIKMGDKFLWVSIPLAYVIMLLFMIQPKK